MSGDMNVGGSVGPVAPIGPGVDGVVKKGVDEALMSSMSPSQLMQQLVHLYMSTPSLEAPVGVSSISTEVAAKIAKIGADIWDVYLEYLKEQKERIREYLSSAAYLAKIQEQSPGAMAKKEAEHAIQLWGNLIDGTSSAIHHYQDESPDGAFFIMASFVISSAFIGDYTNIVDVASTKLVGVNPIQSAAGSLVPLIPETMREQAILLINFFAVGLMTFANAEAIGTALDKGQTPAAKDAVIAFARGVIDKVSGNEVNYLLMALLVHSSENGQPITKQRLDQLAVIAKATMIALALAALYQVETGWLTPDEFIALLNGELKPRSEEEEKLVNLFQQMKLWGFVDEDDWLQLEDALARFIGTKPSVENLIDPLRVYGSAAQFVMNPEPEV